VPCSFFFENQALHFAVPKQQYTSPPETMATYILCLSLILFINQAIPAMAAQANETEIPLGPQSMQAVCKVGSHLQGALLLASILMMRASPSETGLSSVNPKGLCGLPTGMIPLFLVAQFS